MEITISNLTNDITHTFIIDRIGLPILQFENYHIRTPNNGVAQIAGPHQWLPLEMLASLDVYNHIAETPSCTIKYTTDTSNVTLNVVYAAIDNSKLYYRHAQIDPI